MLIQHAGVHDGRPVLDAISATAEQLLRALQLQEALGRLGDVTPREAALDALTAVSHLASFGQSGTAVLV